MNWLRLLHAPEEIIEIRSIDPKPVISGYFRADSPRIETMPDVGNVIEIMKNRDLGVVDELIPLYFDKRSRTMTDVKGLPPQHAWSEKVEQLIMQGFTIVSNDNLPQEWR